VRANLGCVAKGQPSVGETGPMFPVVLRFDGRLAVVIGGGTVADRKVSGLLDAGATVRVVAPMIVAGLRARATAPGATLTLVERPYDPADLDGAWYVVAATGDPVVQQAVADDCERRGIWCNAVDDPERCTALLPAVHRSGDVLVAVSTSGSSPTLARILRDRIANALPASLGEIARTLAERRRVWQADGASTEDRDWAPEIDELLAAQIPRCPAFRNSSDQK
jgi:precorrin-2 dehydrogenase/sirohydrochlorin ferrochelatase